MMLTKDEIAMLHQFEPDRLIGAIGNIGSGPSSEALASTLAKAAAAGLKFDPTLGKPPRYMRFARDDYRPVAPIAPPLSSRRATFARWIVPVLVACGVAAFVTSQWRF